ncbi:protein DETOXIFICATION 42-like [Populus alba]|uniref:protein DETOXIFICATION 42-like n=1 Tax=Populus alba TaxID=43335 RepID=UPI003CC6EAFC
MPLSVFFRDARLVFKKDELGSEIIRIALPAAMALAADPIASLIDTAFIGRLESFSDSLGYVPLFLLENPLVVEAQQFCPS